MQLLPALTERHKFLFEVPEPSPEKKKKGDQ